MDFAISWRYGTAHVPSKSGNVIFQMPIDRGHWFGVRRSLTVDLRVVAVGPDRGRIRVPPQTHPPVISILS